MRELKASRRRSHASLATTVGAIIWLAGITHSLMSLARRQMSASCTTTRVSITRNIVGDKGHLAHDPTADELANQAIGGADIIERLALRGCARVVGIVTCLRGVPGRPSGYSNKRACGGNVPSTVGDRCGVREVLRRKLGREGTAPGTHLAERAIERDNLHSCLCHALAVDGVEPYGSVTERDKVVGQAGRVLGILQTMERRYITVSRCGR
jgi:hypothetical protein